MEGHGGAQNFLAILKSTHPTNRKAATITHPLNLIIYRHMLVARAQEVGMHGMAESVFNRVAGRHQGLTKNLSAEYVGKPKILAVAPVMILTNRAQVQQFHQLFRNLKHACSS